MPLSKQALREKIWRALIQDEVARFPGARSRIPNFLGAEAAAKQLTMLHVWHSARTIKRNSRATGSCHTSAMIGEAG